MTYQAMARKYRPQTFSAVCHQDAVITTLKNALKSGRVAQSYLFCGIRGTGKTTLARLLAKALNCENPSSECEPCNCCTSCTEIKNGSSLDVIEIDGASNRGIDDIRQINDTVGYAPARSKWKIYIIDEVHMLTKEAFNALLKTLEEPPPRVKFLFATTEPHKVLPTILSRCQRFDLSRIAPDAITQKLQSIAADLSLTVDPDAFKLISSLADGSLRDAESLFDQIACYTTGAITPDIVKATLGLTDTTLLFALDQAVAKQNLAHAFELSAHLFEQGKDLKHFFDSLLNHYRTLLRHHLGHPTPDYAPSAQIYSIHECLDILDYLIHWQQQIPASPFKRIDLEMVLLYILRTKQRIPLDQLVSRLEALEKGAPLPSPKAPEPIQPAPEPVAPPVQQAPEPSPLPPKPEPVVPAPFQQAPEPIPTHVAPPQKAPKLDSSIAPKPMAPPPPAPKPAPPAQPGHHDTLLQFAAVELNGTIKK